MAWHLRILFVIVCVLTVTNCSESADLKADATFREDFSSEKLSAFRWGMPTFELFKFIADPESGHMMGGMGHNQFSSDSSGFGPITK